MNPTTFSAKQMHRTIAPAASQLVVVRIADGAGCGNWLQAGGSVG